MKKLLLLIFTIIIVGGILFLLFQNNTKEKNNVEINIERFAYIKCDSIIKISYNEKYQLCDKIKCGDIKTNIVSVDYISGEKKDNVIVDLDIYDGINKILTNQSNGTIYYNSDNFSYYYINNYSKYHFYYIDDIKEDIIKNDDSYYLVSFDTGGGSKIPSTFVEKNKTITEPLKPSRNDDNFIEWQLDGKKFDFETPIKNNTVLKAKWDQEDYIIKVSIIDNMSPDRVIKVYNGDKEISFKELKYMDGVVLCSGKNPTVSKSELYGENEFIVVLEDGTEVSAVIMEK